MLFAGVDSGSRTVKALIIKDDEIIESLVDDMGSSSTDSSRTALETVLRQAGLKVEDIDYIGSTGYGRELVPYAQIAYTDIACHTKGAHWYFPTARTILDLGGQDYKAINCDEKGRVTEFIMNDKCAGGTGTFLEVMANVLEIDVADMGALGLQATKKVVLSSTCTVFAQSEVLNYLRAGADKRDLVNALNNLVADQSFKLLSRINIRKDLVMTGGTSKNQGVVKRIKELSGLEPGLEPLIPPNPQLIGAIGAAVYARAKYLSLQKKKRSADLVLDI